MWSQAATFWLCFLTLIPLASLLGDSTELLADNTSEVIGGLLNATFGNAPELIFSIYALSAGQIRVTQASLLGSILGNLLLVLGSCFLVAGLQKEWRHAEMTFNATSASKNTSILLLSALFLILPAPLTQFAGGKYSQDQDALLISRIASVALIVMYVVLLVFQLGTHRDVFVLSPKGSLSRAASPRMLNAPPQAQDKKWGDAAEPQRSPLGSPKINQPGRLQASPRTAEPEMSMSWPGATMMLLVVTTVIAVFTEMLCDTLDAIIDGWGWSASFVGIILIPIVGNVVEHSTAVRCAIRGRMELAMGISVGSGVQVSLFVIPVTVLAGWCMGVDMTLALPLFDLMVFLVVMIILSTIVSDGKGNWLEGVMLLMAYFMLAVTYWFAKFEVSEGEQAAAIAAGLKSIRRIGGSGGG